MTKVKTLINRFRKDEDGASFLEYTVLLGIILAASIVIIRAVGVWANGQWTFLNTQLNAN